MHLMVFYPGGVTTGFPVDLTDDNEIRDILMTAATIEEGNGNGKIKTRDGSSVDDRPSK